ncbi:MAG: thioredoxin family protein [Bacteroidales bacterium]
MKMNVFILAALFAGQIMYGQGYQAGDKAIDFRLKNVDGKMVSLSDYPDAKGFAVIFTCNSCPYAIAWEDRIIEIDRKYREKGFPVIAINPNDPEVSPKDSYEDMIIRAREKSFPFPYLFDEKQEVFPVYGATRTPHVYLLVREESDLVVKYVGAVDDNYRDASQVKEPYLANAIDALLAGREIEKTETRAIGCTIKVKN